jgi:hypothetical protein
VHGHPSEKLFQSDHDWFKRIGRFAVPPGRGAYIPKRTAFGLPHKYGDNLVVSGPETSKDRRASPLIFHVHKTADGNCFGVALLLPTQFFPGTDVKIGNYKYKYVFDPSVLTDFLDHSGTVAATGTARYFDGQTIIP